MTVVVIWAAPCVSVRWLEQHVCREARCYAPPPPAPPAATVLATLHVSLLNPHRDPEARCFSNQFILQLRLSHLHKTHS